MKMAIDIRDSDEQRAFLKTDHAAAYKQLPLGPDRAKYAMATLLRPTSGARYAFGPQTPPPFRGRDGGGPLQLLFENHRGSY